MQRNKIWWWLIPLALIWPVLHLLVFVMRFGNMPPNGIADALVFLPMGIVSGILFVLLWMRTATRQQRLGLVLGYLVAMPFAFIGSLMSGLMLPPLIGTLLYGGLLLAVGMLIGYGAALLIERTLAQDRRG